MNTVRELHRGTDVPSSGGKSVAVLVHGYLWPILFAALPIFFSTANAQQITVLQSTPALRLADVEVGFNGVYRVGFWTPVTMTFTASEEVQIQADYELLDGDDVTYRIRNHFDFDMGGTKKVVVMIKVGRKPLVMKIHAIRGGLTHKPPFLGEWSWQDRVSKNVLTSTQEAMLEVGGATGLAELTRDLWQNNPDQMRVVPLTDVSALPTDPRALEPFTGIILTTVLNDPKRQPNAEQVHALDEWVRGGGRLLLFATGQFSADPLTPAAPILTLLPGRVKGLEPLRRYAEWEDYSTTDIPIPATQALDEQPLRVPAWDEITGETLLSAGKIPLVIDRARGLGKIRFVAADLSQPPFSNWTEARRPLLKRLIPWYLTAETDNASYVGGQVSRLGYDDLAGQFRTALNQFSGTHVAATWFWLLFGLALLYVALWFPLQGHFLKREVGAPMRWLLALVLLSASGFAAGYITKSSGNAKEQLNTAEVVDLRPVDGTIQARAWAAFYTVNAREISIYADPLESLNLKDPRRQFEWQGLPGGGWGGLDSQLAGPTLTGQPYKLDDIFYGNATQVTLPAGGSKTMSVRWSAQGAPQSVTPLQKRASESGVRGVIRNELGVSLKDCLLIHADWALPLGDLAPGASIDLATKADVGLSAASALTGKRGKGGGVNVVYPRESNDLKLILKMLLLHRAAGGTRYTGLWHRYLMGLDASAKLDENQAVLIGWGPPQTEWKIIEDDPTATEVWQDKFKRTSSADAKVLGERVTAVRIWLPVETRNASDAAPANVTTLRWPGNAGGSEK